MLLFVRKKVVIFVGYLISMTMKSKFISLLTALTIFLSGTAATAQETFSDIVRFEKTTHDFGAIKFKSGPVDCSFSFENISSSPIAILQVATSCGCTSLKWTQEPILPGKKGTISIRYSNDEGPYPFDKTITCFISGVKRPILLRIRGVSVEKEKSLSELYPDGYGALGMRNTDFNLGNVDQQRAKEDEQYIANKSGKAITVTFEDVTPGLELTVSPNPIPANSNAKLRYRIITDDTTWGKNIFKATPCINGRNYADKDPITVKCFVKEDFSRMSENEIKAAALPFFKTSSFEFGIVPCGTQVKGTFSLRNQGKNPLKIHKIEADDPNVTFGDIPQLGYGETGELTFTFDTKDKKQGDEVMIIVTLTTNAPKRPMINLFISGHIK